ncbi:uncharacterized protein [Miscanthus floridulus]|uniref:uncharacterized protein n=1 Tax=Miscanthus floridulus TaxID=154761 RepID=UPI00345A9E25
MSLTVADGGWGSGDGGHRQVFPTLTATNYTSWSIRVQAIMEEQGWWEVVEPSEGNSAAGAVTEALAGKDKKVRAHFFQCLSDKLLMQVAKKKTGKEVWDSLKARFVGAERVKDARLQTLKAEFDALKMKEEETVDEFARKLTAMSVKYGNLGGTLEDVVMVKKLFDTMPDKFIHVIAGIEQFYNLQTLAFDEAVGRLKAFEERTTRRGVGGSRSADEQALLTQVEWEARQKKSGGGESSGGRKSQGDGGRGRGRGRGGGQGGRGGRGEAGRENTVRDKSHIKCFKCQTYRHYANHCPGEKKKDEEAYHVRKVEMEPVVLLAETMELGPLEPASNMSLHTEMILEEKKVMPELFFVGEGEVRDDVWYLDNGASNHMTGDHQKFRELDQTSTRKGGIKHQFTAPYTPQQNGVVERKNRSVMEMARSLLKSMEIPGIFWAEAVRHSVYLLNRLPTKSMGYRTPYEGWNGRKPHLGHLRIFGCKGHVKIVGTHLKKLDDRSVPMVYFGIEEGSKAHRMYNPKTNKFVVSRDVVFEESLKWSWESTDNFSFVENRDEKDGQFYSGDYGSLDSGVGDAQGAQGVNETRGATSGGEQSAGGINAEMGDYDVQTEQNPTIGSEPATP